MFYTLTKLLRKVRHRRELGFALLFGVLTLSIAGNTTTFYLFERASDPPPSLGDSFWYSVISITTIGYGDYSAQTAGARLGTALFIVLMGLAAFTTVSVCRSCSSSLSSW